MQVPAQMVSLHRMLAMVIMSLVVVAGCAPITSVLPRTGVGTNVGPSGPPLNPGNIQPAVAVQQAETLAGRILFVRDGNLWIWQGGNSRQFSQGGTWSQPQFSPDGSEVAYVYWANNFSDVFVMATDGTNSRRLTRGQSTSLPDNSWAMRPTWSPDGSRLAFVSDANSNYNQVWLMAKDGGSRKQLTSEVLGILWVDSMAWEPDGSRLAITAAPDIREQSHIYFVDTARGTFEKFSKQLNGAYDPSFSPDGKAIAYIGRPTSQPALTVQSLDGTQEATFDKLPFLRSPVWSPDGKTIAFLSGQGGVFEIWTLTVNTTGGNFTLSDPRQLTHDAAVDPMSGLSWTR